MGSEHQPCRHAGIYRNLPTFDPSLRGLKAIVTGANGISGFGTLRALLDTPDRWSQIYALSRRPPPEEMMALLSPAQRSRVQHVACDFLQGPDTIASSLKDAGVQADYAFFYSYMQPRPPPGQPLWSNADELVKVNTTLLKNFLDALPNAGIQPKRILLQTGAKNYGVHLGRTRQPCIESDPQPKDIAPNFYYPQEELLFKYCQQHPETGWNIMQPAWIIGAVNNAAMNALHPFAIYAAVQAKKGEAIAFPGDWTAWQNSSFHSTARLTGYLSEWAVLEDKCKNERFNSQDTSPFSFDRFYEELARWYHVSKGVLPPPDEDSKYKVIDGKPGKETPMGYGPPSKMRITFSLVQWAKDLVNAKVWQELQKESGGKLVHDPFENPEDHFSCGDGAASATILSMNKARNMGWTGFVDTQESVFEMYYEMVKLGMLPPMATDSPRSLA